MKLFQIQMDETSICEFVCWDGVNKQNVCWKNKQYGVQCNGELSGRPMGCPMEEVTQ